VREFDGKSATPSKRRAQCTGARIATTRNSADRTRRLAPVPSRLLDVPTHLSGGRERPYDELAASASTRLIDSSLISSSPWSYYRSRE
jgi:hypothetical protein